MKKKGKKIVPGKRDSSNCPKWRVMRAPISDPNDLHFNVPFVVDTSSMNTATITPDEIASIGLALIGQVTIGKKIDLRTPWRLCALLEGVANRL